MQQRSRVAQEPKQPKLRQVHLIPAELHDALQCCGLRVGPGSMGENITKREVALLALPRGTRHAARGCILGLKRWRTLTGLRKPSNRIRFSTGC